MHKKYDYSVWPDNSPEIFKEACRIIESKMDGFKKERLIIDVDGTTIQLYEKDGKEIVVFDNYDVGAVYVESDIMLDGLFEETTKMYRMYDMIQTAEKQIDSGEAKDARAVLTKTRRQHGI